MTPEERLNEVRDWARSAIEAGADGLLKEDLLHLFPELAESEDEKIRTMIAAFVEQFVASKQNREKCLAWLEKHKDCEAEIEKAYKHADEMQYKKGFEAGVESVKSAEWSEEDEKMLQAIIKRYEFAVESDCAVFIKTDRLTQMEKELDWLRTLIQRRRPIIAVDADQLLKILPARQWKPSKEQMDSLKNACIRCKAHNDTKYLPELYTELINYSAQL